MEKAKEAIVRALGSKRDKVRIAIQKDGRLRALSLGIVQSCLEALNASLPEPKPRQMRSRVPQIPKLEILFMRTADMPGALKRKNVEFAFVGTDTLREQGIKTRIVDTLGEGKCSLQIMVKKDSRILNVNQLSGKNIATSFPRLLSRFLWKKLIFAKIISPIKSVETFVDGRDIQAGCDIVETGESMKINDLRPIATVAEFETVLATSL